MINCSENVWSSEGYEEIPKVLNIAFYFLNNGESLMQKGDKARGIWNSSGLDVTAFWRGYKGDWHTISFTFSDSFTLKANETYNYTIGTGSYPQIHHTPALQTTSGWINCTSFVDANGKKYDDWIPAIKLE